MRRMKHIAVLAHALLCMTVWAQTVSPAEMLSRLNLNRSRYDFLDNGISMVTQAEQKHGDFQKVLAPMFCEGICPDCGEPDDSDHWRIKRAARESDLVAVGTVATQLSSLTTQQSFIYTDSEFILADIWKNTRGALVGQEITVTTAGGSVMAGSHTLTASVSVVRPLHRGDQYLLFLKYIPESHSYELVSPMGFDLTGSAITPLVTYFEMPGKRYAENLVGFLQAMKSSTDRASLGDTR